MIDAFIFDLDGVITDTAEYHYLAWKELANKIGIEIDREFNETLKGVSRMESLERILVHGNKKNDFTIEEKEKQIMYSGLFVTNIDELVSLFPPKHGKVFAHHTTTEFMPKSNEGIEIGKEQKLKIIGRASNEKGDALLVENPKSKNKYPHITLSCAEGVSPVYSNQLFEEAAQNGTIEYFPEPVFIDVIEGYENGNRKAVVTDKFLVAK